MENARNDPFACAQTLLAYSSSRLPASQQLMNKQQFIAQQQTAPAIAQPAASDVNSAVNVSSDEGDVVNFSAALTQPGFELRGTAFQKSVVFPQITLHSRNGHRNTIMLFQLPTPAVWCAHEVSSQQRLVDDAY